MKFLKYLALTLMLVVLGSCAKQTSSKKEVTIALSMPGLTSISVQWIITGAKEFVINNPDLNIKLIVVDAQNNNQLQVNQTENLLLQNIQALALFPADTVVAKPIIEKYYEVKIPVVTINALPPDEIQAMASSYVGSDDYEAGLIQANMAVKDMGGTGNLVFIHGGLSTTPHILRNKGYRQVIKENPTIKLLAEQENQAWSTENALKITENWLQGGLQINAVLANSDSIAMGALIAVENANKNINVYGIDALPAALEAVKAGRLKGTVWQDMFQQGWKGAETAYKLAMGESVEKKVLIPFEAVTFENVDSFIERARKRDELNAKHFK